LVLITKSPAMGNYLELFENGICLCEKYKKMASEAGSALNIKTYMQAGDVYLILNVIFKMPFVFERLSLAYVLWNLCQRRKSLYETNVRCGQYSKRFLCVSG
jgi:hypothetical protein